MRIQLITRGDDAGSSRSANRAIRHAFECGILRNVSVMACGAHVEHASETLTGLRGLCVGLHVTLTSEWDHPRWGPVLPADRVPSLVDADGFFPRTVADLAQNNPHRDEVAAEVRAQLDRLRNLGFKVTYLDEHMCIGSVCGIGEVLTELAGIEGLIDADRKVRRLPGFYGDGDDAIGQLRQLLPGTPPGTYVAIGHPAYDDEEMRSIQGRCAAAQGVAQRRDRQRRMFTDAAVLDLCASLRVVPASYQVAVHRVR